MTNNNKPSNARNSSFELLRIITILMIIMCHIVSNSVKVQLTDAASIARLNNGLFNHPFFYKRLLILNIIYPFGVIGNTVFILISGYFLVSKKDKIRITNVAGKLLKQQGFAAFTLVISSTIIYLLTNNMGGGEANI